MASCFISCTHSKTSPNLLGCQTHVWFLSCGAAPDSSKSAATKLFWFQRMMVTVWWHSSPLSCWSMAYSPLGLLSLFPVVIFGLCYFWKLGVLNEKRSILLSPSSFLLSYPLCLSSLPKDCTCLCLLLSGCVTVNTISPQQSTLSLHPSASSVPSLHFFCCDDFHLHAILMCPIISPSTLPSNVPPICPFYTPTHYPLYLYREEEYEDEIEEEEEEEAPVTESDSDEEEGGDTVSRQTAPRYFRTRWWLGYLTMSFGHLRSI